MIHVEKSGRFNVDMVLESLFMRGFLYNALKLGKQCKGVCTLRSKLQKGTHVIQCSMLSPLRGMRYNGLLQAYSCGCDLHFTTKQCYLTDSTTSLTPKFTTWHNSKPVLSTSNSHKLSSSIAFPNHFLVSPYEPISRSTLSPRLHYVHNTERPL
jgi:hypothetical protein